MSAMDGSLSLCNFLKVNSHNVTLALAIIAALNRITAKQQPKFRAVDKQTAAANAEPAAG